MKKRIVALALGLVMVLGMGALAAAGEKTINVVPMTMTINGKAVTPLKSDGTPAEVFAYDGATYVPLRYLSELLGIEVKWDAEHNQVAQLVSDKLPTPKLAHAAVYGVYSLEGDAVDSAIRADVYQDLATGAIVKVDFDEALLPASVGGAEGWAEVDEETAAKLGGAVVPLNNKTFAACFTLGGMTWNGRESAGGVVYTAQVEGRDVEFVSYVGTQAGGKWYDGCRAEGAKLIGGDGKEAVVVTIETKASIGHGTGFWPSPLKFTGNIEAIENFVIANGVHYDYAPSADFVKNDDGVWEICDAATGATLAGAPNYFNLVKLACEEIAAGSYVEE